MPSLLRDLYFRPHRDGFQVSPDLCSHVVFAHHNLLRDAPFTRARDSGFDRHILKPVEPDTLFRVLREVSPSAGPPS